MGYLHSPYLFVLLVLFKTPNTPDIVVVVLVVLVLVAIVEVLVPRVVGIVLGGAPVVRISKATNNNK